MWKGPWATGRGRDLIWDGADLEGPEGLDGAGGVGDFCATLEQLQGDLSLDGGALQGMRVVRRAMHACGACPNATLERGKRCQQGRGCGQSSTAQVRCRGRSEH